MGEPREPAPVKLLIAVLWAASTARDAARERAQAMFGPIDCRSEAWLFDATDYYAAEMGRELRREFWAFERLTSPAGMADWKRATNAWEDEWRREGGTRVVNLDPGYLHFAHVALASTKPFSHRIYLRDGIYAEVTLLWRHGGFETLPWTFPEYRTPRVQAFLAGVRERYRLQCQATGDRVPL